jgi:hypothetical protein
VLASQAQFHSAKPSSSSWKLYICSPKPHDS